MNHQDKQLDELLKMSKVEIPSVDFEKRVMQDIAKIEARKSSILKMKYYSTIFFMVALFCGFIFTYLATKEFLTDSFFQEFRTELIIASQIIYVVLIILFSNKIFSLLKLRRMV